MYNAVMSCGHRIGGDIGVLYGDRPELQPGLALCEICNQMEYLVGIEEIDAVLLVLQYTN